METIFHFLLPLLVLLALFPALNRKAVWLLSPLAILPDIDFYIGHRYLFHNIFFVFIVSGMTYILFSRTRLGRLSAGKAAFLLSLFFLSSHLLLDLGGPGVGLFYPAYDRLIRVDFLVLMNPADSDITHRFLIATNPLSAATRSQDAPAITTSGLLILAVFATPLLAVLVANRLKGKGKKTIKIEPEEKPKSIEQKPDDKENPPDREYDYLKRLAEKRFGAEAPAESKGDSNEGKNQ